MSIHTRLKPLAVLLLGASACMAAGGVQAATPAQGAGLPACTAANYDAARNLFTIMPKPAPAAKGAVPPAAQSLPVNEQCLLTVLPRSQADRVRAANDAKDVRTAGGAPGAVPNNAGEVLEGRYVVQISDGGDGGAGGTLRENGGGGGGAGAVARRTVVTLTPGTYKLTLGAGGPGGAECKDPLPGGPGWPGAPSNISRLDGTVVAGTPGADSWKRPSRRELDRMAGPIDGHGGKAPGKTAGGSGGTNIPGYNIGAREGERVAAAPGTPPAAAVQVAVAPGFASTPPAFSASGPSVVVAPGAPGDTGAGELPRSRPRIGAGGGGGAGTGDGGDGADEAVLRRPDTLAEAGNLGGGGGGGAGRANTCSAGGAGGNGYVALRRL